LSIVALVLLFREHGGYGGGYNQRGGGGWGGPPQGFGGPQAYNGGSTFAMNNR